jgi:hypothetical protein
MWRDELGFSGVVVGNIRYWAPKLSARWSCWCAFVLVIVTPTVAWAEVMDKEPAPAEVWAWAICGGAAAGVAWNVRAWLGAMATAVLARFFVGIWSELADPFVGPAIRAETGTTYLTTVACATAVATALASGGAFGAFRRARNALR